MSSSSYPTERADLSRRFLSNKTTFITVRTLLAEHGVKKVGEGKRVFVKIPIDTLLVKVLDLLDSRTVAYKIHPPVVGMGKTVYTRSVSYMEKLKSEGVLYIRSRGSHSPVR
ncbi:MAG: hypothetical protein Q9N34_05805 [Aquificota bacterium]|nr:hypothetical protein [Aquificota bacterium]